jgi:hypothetical protein
MKFLFDGRGRLGGVLVVALRGHSGFGGGSSEGR